MKKTYLNSFCARCLTLLVLALLSTNLAWGASPSWTYTFISPDAISNNNITVNDATWTVETTTGKGSPSISTGKSNGYYGLKFGSSKDHYYGSVTLTTSYFQDKNVKSVTVKILNNGSKLGTFTAKQGNTTIGSTSSTFGQEWTDMKVNTNKGTGGDLVLTYSVEQAFYINTITVEFEEATPTAAYTVTFDAGTNGTCGTTSLTEASAGAGVTLPECTANTGYVFKGWSTTEGGTTPNAGKAGETYKPSSNCTLYAVYAKTYVLTITQPTAGGTLSVTDGANTLNIGDIIEVGTNLTCEVTNIPEGKRFSRFYAKWGEGEKENKYKGTNPATFDNLTKDVLPEDISALEVYVTYKDLEKYTINYMVNGVNTGAQENVYEGTALEFPVVNDFGGKVFVGWSETEIAEETDIKPTLVETTDLTAKANATYYAVYAKEDISETKSLVKMAKGDKLQNGDKIVIVAHETVVALYRETINTSYVNTYTFDNDVNTISLNSKYWVPVTSVTGGFTLGDSEDGFLYNEGNNLYCGNTDRVWILQDLNDGTFKFMTSGADNRYLSYRSDLSNKYWRMGGTNKSTSGQTILDIYKYNTQSLSYSNYTTFVGYTRDLTENFGTLCLPCAATIEGAEVYSVEGVDSKDAPTTLYLTKVEGTTEAGVPYIIKPTEDKLVATYSGDAVATAGDANGLVGSFEKAEITAGAKNYILKNNLWCYVPEGNTNYVGANKAYLNLADVPVKAEAKGDYEMIFDGDVTSINLVPTTEEIGGTMYNLNGMKVNASYKGIVVKNGKKFINK